MFTLKITSKQEIKDKKYRAALQTYVKEQIKDAFLSANRLEEFERQADVDYDKVFQQIAIRCAQRNPLHVDNEDLADMIADVLGQVINKTTVEKYDPSKPIIAYFGGMFRNRMFTALKLWTTRKVKQKKNNSEEFSDEEVIDYQYNEQRDSYDPGSAEENVNMKQLVKDLSKYLKRYKSGTPSFDTLFYMLMQGHSSKEIAEASKTSVANISKKVKKLWELIKDFALEERNEDLLHALEQVAKTKKHKQTDEEFFTKFPDIFKLYKKKCGELKSKKLAVPIGDISRIKKTTKSELTPNKIEHISVDSKHSSKELSVLLDSYYASLAGEQDVIVDNSKICLLRVV